MHIFSCGNKQTLLKEGMRQNLLDFHSKWYSSNIMTLVVAGDHSLEELETWVTTKFSLIENKNVVVPDLGVPAPYGPEQLGKIIKYKPVKDKDTILFNWTLPYYHREVDSNPLSYLTYLFGDEGENSLLSYLSSKGLATGVSSGDENQLNSYSTFSVEVTLTDDGLKHP
jgi:insulysin